MTILIRKIYAIIFIIITTIISECELNNNDNSVNIINHDIVQTYYSNNSNVGDIRNKLKFAVLLPWNAPIPGAREVAPAVLSAINLAVNDLQKPGNIFYHYDISIVHRDTNCSSTTGPLAAFEIYSSDKKPGVYMHTCLLLKN